MKNTTDDVDKKVQENLRIGSQIRDLRKSKKISIADMAKKIGKSIGYISQVERGSSSLPIPILQSISEVLGVNITWFFHTDDNIRLDELDFVVRKNSRRSLNFFGTGISEELLSPKLSGHLLMILTTFSPGAKSDKTPRKNRGEEAAYVQSGNLELTIGDKLFNLEAGDSFSLSGEEPHFICNPSTTQDAVVIWTLIASNY
jgi:transcriptional regulator with XRE-family HTH domain